MAPIEVSVNLTSRGAVPDVVDAVKDASMSDTVIFTGSAEYFFPVVFVVIDSVTV